MEYKIYNCSHLSCKPPYDIKKKRTAIWLHKTEFFNLSQTTEEDLKYYLNDRREREIILICFQK